MTKAIIYTRPDGGVSVLHPAPRARREGETEDGFAARIAAGCVPGGATDVRIVDAAAIPVDRTFRNAWRVNGSGVYCEMVAAKGIARDMLRAERVERFKTIDGQWMRAMGRGDTAAASAIEAKRETLRNWPADPRIEACGAPDELKAVIAQIKDGG